MFVTDKLVTHINQIFFFRNHQMCLHVTTLKKTCVIKLIVYKNIKLKKTITRNPFTKKCTYETWPAKTKY